LALAFDRAAILYRLVLENARNAERDVALRRKLATALANTGRCAEAAEQCLAAAPFAAEDEALELHRDAALRYLTSGHVDLGIQTLRGVLNKVGMRLPLTAMGALTALGWWRFQLALRPVRPRLRRKTEIPARKLRQLDACWSTVAGLSVVDPLRAAAFVVRHLYLALDAGEPERVLRGLAAYTGHVAIGGSRSRRAAGKVLEQLRVVAKDVEGQYPRAMLSLASGIIAHLEGRWDEAWQFADDAEQLFKNAEQQDVAWELDTAQTFAMWARMYAGRWRELAERQPDLRRGAIERDDLFGRLNFGARMATCVLLAADRPHEARKVIDDDESVAVAGAFHVQHHNLLLARVMIELYEGRSTAAWEAIADGWRRYKHSLLTYVEQVRVDFLHMHGTAALAAARETKSPQQLDVIEQIIRRLRREQVPWAQAIGTLFEAALSLLRSEQQAAIDKLSTAASQFESAQMWLLAAAARWRLSQLTNDSASKDAALTRFQAEGILEPERVVNMFLPT
jgi:hypothetical protein